jgi:adenine-specific DNA-methyltransferase
MAAIKDLLRQITDPTLRERLTVEIDRIAKNKKFGLVFEEHIPECTPLYGVPIRRGSTVARKTGKMKQIFTVKKTTGATALCADKTTLATEPIPFTELVSVAQFGEPIFPSLEPIAKVQNAPGDSLWHTLIEADNYHALQLLEYLYEGQVDCIYIDPPYNTGARDWKYNNDYVDSTDAYKHSKWLSMMKKRLLLASRLLNSENSVLVVTIDEHEFDYLSVLLSDLFPEARIQMVSTLINPASIARFGEFGRCNEYIFFVMFGSAAPLRLRLNREWVSSKGRTHTGFVRWDLLRRSGLSSARKDSPGCFYTIYVDPANHNTIVSVGDALPEGISEPPPIDGLVPVLPIKKNGSEGRWQWTPATFRERQLQGRVKASGDPKRGYTIYILKDGEYSKIQQGEFQEVGRSEDGSLLTEGSGDANYVMAIPSSQWRITTHDSTQYGSRLVNDIMPDRYFPFPKSLYAVKDTIGFFVADKPNALIVDFFAGSGTTLHAVNLLNAEDEGNRRCILVTNNEVSEAETRELKAQGYQPGDSEWESHGICRSMTWPRTEYSILGKRKDGTMLSGEYFTSQTTTKDVNRSFYQLGFVENLAALTPTAKKQIVALIGKDKLAQSLVKADSRFIVSKKHTASVLFDPEAADEWLAALEEQEHITDFYIVAKDARAFNDVKAKIVDLLGTVTVTEPLKRPMSEGFPANVEYFKLGFLDKNSVSLGQQFAEILPLLWLKAGAVGERPELDGEALPPWLFLPQNAFAVLLDEDRYGEFAGKLAETENIRVVYFVTNSEEAFREMSDGIGTERTYQLYRDYIDNFVIGSRRNNL